MADIPVASGQASLNVFGEKIGCPFRPGPFVEYLEAERPAQNEPVSNTMCSAQQIVTTPRKEKAMSDSVASKGGPAWQDLIRSAVADNLSARAKK
jgi:hypothetical protein